MTPEASPGRQSLERRSALALLWLHQLPAWVVPLVLVVLLVVGLAVNGVGGAVALAALAVVLIWMASVSWPRLNASGRLLRVFTIAVVVGVTVLHLLNRKL